MNIDMKTGFCGNDGKRYLCLNGAEGAVHRNDIASNGRNFEEKSNIKLREPEGFNPSGFLNVKNQTSFTGGARFDKFLTNAGTHKALEFISNNSAVCLATVALFLGGILRPITIMGLPGKKDIDDKKYASGHAIASAIIGFVTTSILLSPVSKALKKVGDRPWEFLCEVSDDVKKFGKNLVKQDLSPEEIEKAIIGKVNEGRKENPIKSLAEIAKPKLKYLFEEGKAFQNANAFRTASKTFNLGVDFILAIPKATLTIALIPPILKHVFGLEKGKKQAANSVNKTSYSMINFNNKKDDSVFKTFMGGR